MEATRPRPTAVSVIGWGAIVAGVLMFFGGVMACPIASTMPSEPLRPSTGPEDSVDFVFRNVLYFGLAQIGLAVVVVLAGRALLRLRKWGSRVIQVFAAFLIAYAAVFLVYFAVEFRRALAGADKAPPIGFVMMMGVTLVFTLLLWLTPTVLTLYHLLRLGGQNVFE